MQTRQLGNSDLQITRIGYGAWAIGGAGWEAAWGAQDDGEAIGAIQAAIDGGMNWIDTAAVYGLGHSEELVAKALKGRDKKPYIFTKSSKLWDKDRKVISSMKSIRKEIEDSLSRLQTDVVDLYQIHWPNPDEEIEEGWAAMAKLKEEGKVRWIGVSNFNVAQMERAAKIAPITSLQPPYSLVDREVEAAILPYCEQHNIGVINYSPMGAGLLTGAMTVERARNLPADDWRSRSENFREPRLLRHIKLVELLTSIGEQHGRTPGEVAIAWTLRLPVVTAAIVGARSAKQVTGIIGAMDLVLSPDEIEQIEAFCRENP